jgi:hypothetical protein
MTSVIETFVRTTFRCDLCNETLPPQERKTDEYKPPQNGWRFFNTHGGRYGGLDICRKCCDGPVPGFSAGSITLGMLIDAVDAISEFVKAKKAS